MRERLSTESDFDTLCAIEADAYARGVLRAPLGGFDPEPRPEWAEWAEWAEPDELDELAA